MVGRSSLGERHRVTSPGYFYGFSRGADKVDTMNDTNSSRPIDGWSSFCFSRTREDYPPLRPFNERSIDTHDSPLHQAHLVKLPEFDAIGSVPLALRVVPLIPGAHRHPVPAESPKSFLE